MDRVLHINQCRAEMLCFPILFRSLVYEEIPTNSKWGIAQERSQLVERALFYDYLRVLTQEAILRISVAMVLGC